MELFGTADLLMVYQLRNARRIAVRDRSVRSNVFLYKTGTGTDGIDPDLAVSRKTRVSQQGFAVWVLCILSASSVDLGTLEVFVNPFFPLVLLLEHKQPE